ncbi:uncharacterized protein LOC135081896 [Ostrinia nubilalis]|uniref:uncharacterized protein LOC135081896 n=1 Tax=Ostrinia nubilalis TaxID=29057 RepID=UPI0030824A95
MQKKLCFALSLTVLCYWTEASPAKLGTLEFDKLDTDLDNLKYEVEEEDLDDFSKLLDEEDQTKSENDKAKEKVKTSAFKKKNTTNKGSKTKYDLEDLKKFFKTLGVKDQGKYYDDNLYAAIKALVGEAVGVKGTEDRKYKKGTKTRGFHRVQHKDEYKKDKEFYEDDETTGEINKVGGKALGYEVGGGIGFNKGHYNHKRLKGVYGKEGFLDKGYLDKNYNKFSDDQGFEGTYSNDS